MGRNKNKQNKQKPARNKRQNNSEEQPTSVKHAKEKHSWRKLLKKIFSKLPFLSIAFWGISVLSIVSVVLLVFSLLQGSFSSKNVINSFNNFNSAKSAFENRTGVAEEWFQEGIQPFDTLFYVNIKKNEDGNKMFVCITTNDKNEFLFKDVNNTNNAVKHIIKKDTAKFDEFIKQFLSVKENDGVDSIVKKIGAKSTYIKFIKDKYPNIIKNQRDVIFSLIYNTIVGNPQGHIAVTIENQKLKIITAKDFVWDRIDASLFKKSMNWVAGNDTLSNKDKYILASCERLSNNQQNDCEGITKNKFKAYFKNDKIVNFNSQLPVSFLYYDYRKDVLHIGVNEFSIKNAKTKQYLSRLKSSPEKVFYLVENDTTLYDFSNFDATNDTILWGKIDFDKLAKGKFQTDDFANDYGIIKTWGKPYLPYIVIFVLFLQIFLSIFFWIIKLKKQPPKTKEIEIDETKLIEEPKIAINNLKELIAKFKIDIIKKEEENTALVNKNKELTTENAELNTKVGNALIDFQALPVEGEEAIKAVLNVYDKVLKRKSMKEFEKFKEKEKENNIRQFKEKEKFDILKSYSDILNKTKKIKKEAELLDWLNELRKLVKTLPEIPSLKKIYQDLEKDEKSKQRPKDEIIVSLLSRVDEYAKGKELLPQFNDYKSQTEDYQKIKPTYKATQTQVYDFYNLCLRLQKKDTPDFWDRTALSVWAISKFALPILNIWGKQVWFADKSDSLIDSLKSDLLQIYTTRYFLRDTIESKSFEDFNIALNKEIPQKIAEYNIYILQEANASLNSIDTNLKNQLTAVLKKIKKFDSSQEFNDRMWDNFVKVFLQKAPKIESDEDKAWFFEQLFNITYHTADYLDFIKNNKNIIYCYNHQFLHNNFDLSITEHYDFQLNHIEKSTPYSNHIYKWADELGIRQLKVLIGKYLVKP